MKTCKKCNSIFDESFNYCPMCGNPANIKELTISKETTNISETDPNKYPILTMKHYGELYTKNKVKIWIDGEYKGKLEHGSYIEIELKNKKEYHEIKVGVSMFECIKTNRIITKDETILIQFINENTIQLGPDEI